MFQTINGVQLREHDETKILPNVLESDLKLSFGPRISK